MTEKIKKPVGRPPKPKGKQPPKNPVGRPKVDIDLEQLENLSQLNCTMPEIAAYFKVPLRTLEDKYTNDPAVRAAIDQGRELESYLYGANKYRSWKNITIQLWLSGLASSF